MTVKDVYKYVTDIIDDIGKIKFFVFLFFAVNIVFDILIIIFD